MSSKVALVLSGGGAKGAFQFGAIQYIEEYYKKQNPSFNYSIIAGVSVGALNATMLGDTLEFLREGDKGEDKPVNALPADLYYPFDPSGNNFEYNYVWHCHIVDHEDNEMMRPDVIELNPFAPVPSLRPLRRGWEY